MSEKSRITGPRKVRLAQPAGSASHSPGKLLKREPGGRRNGSSAAADRSESLAASLAHELNQPLTALALAARACGHLARVGEINREEMIEAIDLLTEQAERAGELVRRLRQLVAGAGPHYSEVDLAELLLGVVKMVQADLTNAQVVVKWHLPEPVLTISLDRVQIEQVLVNLIRNSVDAMSETLEDQRILTITASVHGDEAVVAIGDTGRGLSPEIAERLFQPYQTTKPQGMGLGLAVSHAILQAHAGRLWVEPAHGRGTTFCFALPLASRES